MQKIINSYDLNKELTLCLNAISFDKLFVLTDKNTHNHCFPLINSNLYIQRSICIEINPGDSYKNIDSLSYIWQQLSDNGATRHSLIINLGGGMISDIGGFAASTFKRGIKFINIPTTLLGAVDASVGGKTGINFNNLKNEIGSFSLAQFVVIDSHFFLTLDYSTLISGYAELFKQSLLDSDEFFSEALTYDFDQFDLVKLNQLVFKSIDVKNRFVSSDPYENGIRKALNFGHTIGHAFESLSFRKGYSVQHGVAVAWGMACELYLSEKLYKFPKEKFYKAVYFIQEYYSHFPFTCNDYEAFYDLMKHDKKNYTIGNVNFTLLSDVGNIVIDQKVDKNLVFESIDFLRESLGL